MTDNSVKTTDLIEGIGIAASRLDKNQWYAYIEETGKIFCRIKQLEQYGKPVPFYGVIAMGSNYVPATIGDYPNHVNNCFSSLEEAAETYFIMKLAQ